jgi:hypothetical protein
LLNRRFGTPFRNRTSGLRNECWRSVRFINDGLYALVNCRRKK